MNTAPQVQPEDPSSLALEISKAVEHLRSARIDGDGTVDYEGYRSSPEYWGFLRLLRRVESMDPSELVEKQARAFWLNLYNAAAVHGIVQHGFPEDALGRRRFYGRALVHVGGKSLSLDDIEHGILRGNQRAPGRLTRPFGMLDGRQLWSLPTDPRIHFAINCGARSCPPIRFYRVDELNSQLDLATRSFLSQEVRIEAGALLASPLLDWYGKDFGDVLAFVARYHDDEAVVEACRDPSIKLNFSEYDWSSNSVF